MDTNWKPYVSLREVADTVWRLKYLRVLATDLAPDIRALIKERHALCEGIRICEETDFSVHVEDCEEFARRIGAYLDEFDAWWNIVGDFKIGSDTFISPRLLLNDIRMHRASLFKGVRTLCTDGTHMELKVHRDDVHTVQARIVDSYTSLII